MTRLGTRNKFSGIDVIEWLLQSDPAVRWQVLRDVTDASPTEVAAERARVEHDAIRRNTLRVLRWWDRAAAEGSYLPRRRRCTTTTPLGVITMPVQLPGRVSVEEGVEFATGGGRPLRCDVYLPAEHADDRAAVLLIHGGGWATGDRSQLRGYGIQLARYGFVCVCPEYRLSGEATWPAQLHDVKAAMRWMRANADRYGIDASKMCVSGNSAGAHLALMLAGVADGHLEADLDAATVSTECAAVVAIYPPTMLRVDDAENAVGVLLGGKVSREIEDEASPINYARADFPPTMLVHGNADTVVPVEASFEMYKAMSAAGASVEMHIYDGVPHAFDSDAMFGRHIADLIALFLDRKVRQTT